MSYKKPNWVDYANLVLNVAQSAQLNELRALASLRAERAEKQEYENRLREFFWALEAAFDSYVRKPSAPPGGRYIVAKQMIAALMKESVTSSSFSQFEDKDRFGRFFNRLEQAIDEAVCTLTPGQIADAETYGRYEVEAQELEALIQEKKTKCQEIELKLAEVNRQKNTAIKKLEELRAQASAPQVRVSFWRRALNVVLVGSAVTLLVLAIAAGLAGIVSIGVFLYRLVGESPGSGSLFGYGVALLVGAGVLVVLAGALLPESEKPLQDRIREAEQQIAAADTKTAELKSELNAGNLSGLLAEQEARMAFKLKFWEEKPPDLGHA